MSAKRPGTEAPVWQHLAESGALAFLLTWLAGYRVVPWLPAVMFIVVFAGLAAAVTAKHTGSVGIAGYMLLWIPVLAGWLAADKLAYHNSWATFLMLAAVVGGLVVAGVGAFSRHYEDQRREKEKREAASRSADLRKWNERFTTIGFPNVRAEGMELHPNGNQTIRARIHGGDRTTLTSLQHAETTLAIQLRKKDGQVSWLQGEDAGEVILKISDVDVLAEVIPYPDIEEQLTVNEPFTLGLDEEGDQGQILAREIAAMISGVLGSGKTNLLNVLIAKLSSCVDTIIFAIDVSGTGLVAPWIRGWVEAQVAGTEEDRNKHPRPVITWVATTRAEAWLMLQAIDRLVDARRRGLTRKSKITPSAFQPQYVVVGDEIADIFGLDVPKIKQTTVSNHQFSALGFEIVRKCRAPAIFPIWATQRATVTMVGSGDMKSQENLRIALGAVAEADARSAIPDSEYLAKLIARLKNKGSGVVWLPTAPRPRPWKFYRLDTHYDEDAEKIFRIAARNSLIRPAIPAADLAALGDDFLTRWERSELYQQLAAEIPDAQLRKARRARTAAQPPAATKTEDKREQVKQFDDVLAGHEELADLVMLGREGQNPSRLRMIAIIQNWPVMGIQVSDIVAQLEKEGLGVDRGTVHGWLNQEAARGVVFNRNKRWYPRTDRDQAGPENTA